MTFDLISAPALAQQSDRASVAIVDCRFSLADPQLGRQQYDRGHIPGAYYLDLDRDLSSPKGARGGRHPLPTPDALAPKLAAMGIEPETLVVAYDDSKGAFAARLWWLLRYWGRDRVALLDGGWSAWVAGGYPISTEVPAPKAGNFQPQVRTDWTVDLEEVKARKDLPGVVLIDARESDRYRGDREPIDPVAGHIPGAVNHFWQDACDDRGFFLPPNLQQQRWAHLAPEDEIIVYCGSGVTACVNLWSMAAAGISGAKLYPGGWSEWCSAETPPA
ncbi:sulfurtransferase [Oscillatoria sp. FACHB-1406]|uniref:sulfurtransferase n=1 Tax=Oscillatoria sp. FACHB-1406 TaxID=2692846 RepID=UPI0016843CC0|nr:sulfurtransferase [Oscillatoria sp. FACHB-1406]MBD2577323.1 sulfurtransferase [Oscillatoria sp. FACHB-1406]